MSAINKWAQFHIPLWAFVQIKKKKNLEKCIHAIHVFFFKQKKTKAVIACFTENGIFQFFLISVGVGKMSPQS